MPLSRSLLAPGRTSVAPFGVPPGRRGVTLPEVLVVLALLFLIALVAITSLPRGRETARLSGCRRNLMQIGVAVKLYDRSEGRLPTVPRLGTLEAATGGPLNLFLSSLNLPHLSELDETSRLPAGRPGRASGERLIRGFTCPSDRFVTGPNGPPAPVSYRATTGDTSLGANGGFAPGLVLRLRDIEAGDGLGYTAAFSERLLGTRRPGEQAPANYFVVPGPVADSGCGDVVAADWRGDAGQSWLEASWRSTLYTHAVTPGASRSCISAGGGTAFMGASSGHPAGVNTLIFDGSVRTVVPSIDSRVWKSLGTFQGEGANSATEPLPQHNLEHAPSGEFAK